MSKYRCPVCGRVFEKVSSLKRHYRRSCFENPLKCPCCGREFHNETAMMSHLFGSAWLDDDHAMYFYLHTSRWSHGEVVRIIKRRGIMRLKVD